MKKPGQGHPGKLGLLVSLGCHLAAFGAGTLWYVRSSQPPASSATAAAEPQPITITFRKEPRPPNPPPPPPAPSPPAVGPPAVEPPPEPARQPGEPPSQPPPVKSQLAKVIKSAAPAPVRTVPVKPAKTTNPAKITQPKPAPLTAKAAPRAPAPRPAPKTASPGITSQARYKTKATQHYPQAAQRARQQGSVTVSVLVNTRGLAQSVKLIRPSGHPALDDAALRCASKSTFFPALKNGIPQATWIQASFRFKL